MASYRRERTKVKEGGRSGWFLYPYMAFLPGYMKSPDDELLEYMHQVTSFHSLFCSYLLLLLCCTYQQFDTIPTQFIIVLYKQSTRLRLRVMDAV